jgi:hypothetical protein
VIKSHVGAKPENAQSKAKASGEIKSGRFGSKFCGKEWSVEL